MLKAGTAARRQHTGRRCVVDSRGFGPAPPCLFTPSTPPGPSPQVYVGEQQVYYNSGAVSGRVASVVLEPGSSTPLAVRCTTDEWGHHSPIPAVFTFQAVHVPGPPQ